MHVFNVKNCSKIVKKMPIGLEIADQSALVRMVALAHSLMCQPPMPLTLLFRHAFVLWFVENQTLSDLCAQAQQQRKTHRLGPVTACNPFRCASQQG